MFLFQAAHLSANYYFFIILNGEDEMKAPTANFAPAERTTNENPPGETDTDFFFEDPPNSLITIFGKSKISQVLAERTTNAKRPGDSCTYFIF